MENGPALEKALLELRSIGLRDLRKVLHRLGRPEAKATTIEQIMEQLRTALRQNAEPKLISIFAALDQLSKLECVDTVRLRAIFLDPVGAVPTDRRGKPFFTSKEQITGAPRTMLVNSFREMLLFSIDTDAAIRQLQLELEAHLANFAVNDAVMFTTGNNQWRQGYVQSVSPLRVILPDLKEDQEPLEVLEVCNEETYYAAEIKRAYHSADENGDGILERQELIQVMRALGFTKTDRELEAMFEAMDSDKNGYVDFDEFVDWVMGDRPTTESITKARWANGMKLQGVTSSSGERVPMRIHDAGYVMCGPGVEIMGMRAGYEGEMDLVGVSEHCIKADNEVSGVAFESHGYGFQVCFATAKHRWSGTDDVDFGVSLVNKETEPYTYENIVHPIEMGSVLVKTLGKYRLDGRTTSTMMINKRGKFELRHNGKTAFMSSIRPRYPLFVKVFSSEKGPLLQDLRWIGPDGKC